MMRERERGSTSWHQSVWETACALFKRADLLLCDWMYTCGHFCRPWLTETTLCPYAYVYSSSSSYDGPQLILFGVDVGTVLPWCIGPNIGILRMHGLGTSSSQILLHLGFGVGGLSRDEFFAPTPLWSSSLMDVCGCLGCLCVVLSYWQGSGLSYVWGRSHTRWWLGLCPRQTSADPFPSMGLPLAGAHASWPPAWLLPQWGIWPCVPLPGVVLWAMWWSSYPCGVFLDDRLNCCLYRVFAMCC